MRTSGALQLRNRVLLPETPEIVPELVGETLGLDQHPHPVLDLELVDLQEGHHPEHPQRVPGTDLRHHLPGDPEVELHAELNHD